MDEPLMADNANAEAEAVFLNQLITPIIDHRDLIRERERV